MNKELKLKQLHDFFEEHKYLPEQGSKAWLESRKFFIGGSEMGTIAGTNPYKNLRQLVEGHLGLAPFTGNINTLWGSVLEDYTVQILEEKWNCKIKETGSLPGAIHEQKYSPDGLVYIEFLDQIVLLEIKNGVRRVANGKVPASYKPQIFTGLATIPFADRALFIDSMFRRCSLSDYNFTTNHDIIIHPKKPVDSPIMLGAVFIYEETYSGEYDIIKAKYISDKNDESQFIDGGLCKPDDLAELLASVKNKKLKRYFPYTVLDTNLDTAEYKKNIVKEFLTYAQNNDYTPICLLPLKLFKFEIVPIERNDWKKVYDRKTRKYVEAPTEFKNYVEAHSETIKRVIAQIKELDGKTETEIHERLDVLYPTCSLPSSLTEDISDYLIKSMMI